MANVECRGEDEVGFGGEAHAEAPGEIACPEMIDETEYLHSTEEIEYLGTVDAVARLLEDEFGPGKNWPWAWARRPDLAECIIDVIFSIRARSVDADRIVERWRRWREEQGVEVATARDLAVALRELPGLKGPGADDSVSGAHRPVFPRNRVAGRPKSVVAEDAARALDDAGIVGLDGLRARLGIAPATLRDAWLGVHGLGETSFCHLRLLADSDVLDPGVRVLRFLGQGRAVPSAWAKDVILGVSDYLEVPPVAAEYALSLLAARTHVRPKGRRGTRRKTPEAGPGAVANETAGADAA